MRTTNHIWQPLISRMQHGPRCFLLSSPLASTCFAARVRPANPAALARPAAYIGLNGFMVEMASVDRATASMVQTCVTLLQTRGGIHWKRQNAGPFYVPIPAS